MSPKRKLVAAAMAIACVVYGIYLEMEGRHVASLVAFLGAVFAPFVALSTVTATNEDDDDADDSP